MTLEEISTRLEEARKEFNELYVNGKISYQTVERMNFLDSLIDELFEMRNQLEDEGKVW